MAIQAMAVAHTEKVQAELAEHIRHKDISILILLIRVSRLMADACSERELGDAVESIPSDCRLLVLESLILCADSVSLWRGCCPVRFLDFVISIFFLLGLDHFSFLFFVGSLVWFHALCFFNWKILLRHAG